MVPERFLANAAFGTARVMAATAAVRSSARRDTGVALAPPLPPFAAHRGAIRAEALALVSATGGWANACMAKDGTILSEWDDEHKKARAAVLLRLYLLRQYRRSRCGHVCGWDGDHSETQFGWSSIMICHKPFHHVAASSSGTSIAILCEVNSQTQA